MAAYLRTQPGKASIAVEKAQRLQQHCRSAEQRVDVKQMLTYFMRCRGLKRLEGELNTIRLQTNSQASLQIDDWQLPQEFCLHTGSIPHRLLKEMLEYLPVGLRSVPGLCARYLPFRPAARSRSKRYEKSQVIYNFFATQ